MRIEPPTSQDKHSTTEPQCSSLWVNQLTTMTTSGCTLGTSAEHKCLSSCREKSPV